MEIGKRLTRGIDDEDNAGLGRTNRLYCPFFRSKPNHLVPRSIWKNLSDRVKKIWDDPKNRLDSNGYKDHNAKSYGPKGGSKVKCKDYAKAVDDKLSRYLEDKGVDSPEELSNGELQDFANEIGESSEGDIGAYNAGVAEEIAAAEAATAVEATEALTIAIEIDEVILTTSAIIK